MPDPESPIDPSTARRYVAGQLGLFLLTLAHALLTWPLSETVALFAGGVAVAFAVEAPAIRGGGAGDARGCCRLLPKFRRR
ncbi:hypothetical protein [Halolamina salifodinae]|uniref:Uncharacterized protein n=1 Tax=Halolamina salifodinae TaxID=1202767 RepID=A0A8T4GYH4_9EURY|nr:hypothetical protein [Halolamina salifodinae]MBP1988069.1 hypothetical protein [Halolamina salifodinae]